MKFWLILKLVAIGALSLVILIALFLVDGLITDRQNYRKQATESIASSYASEQRIVGPVLVQPYRQVIAEERVRMSRELHDLGGHTVNLLVVQAGAARMTLDRDPAQARELLKGMEQTGRETLADLDRVLATLRADSSHGDDESDTTNPAPGLAQLPDLVGRFHDSGVDARLSVDPRMIIRNMNVSTTSAVIAATML